MSNHLNIKSYQLLKLYNTLIEPEIPPNSTSEHSFFKIFLGGMPPDPLALAC